MIGVLKQGYRVRVTRANAMPGFQPGEVGTLKGGPFPASMGGYYYLVRMDKDEVDGDPIVFLAEEIEVVDQ